MPRKCTICARKDRARIEAAMLSPDLSIRDVAKRFQLTSSAVHRHKESHLPAAAIAKQLARDEERGQSLAEFWADLKRRAERLANEAQRDKDRKGETAAIRELSRLIDLGLRAASELRKPDQANAPLHQHKDWPGLVAALMSALAQYPDAFEAVRSAFEEQVTRGAA